jgi:CheY-like chemotaxis protein
MVVTDKTSTSVLIVEDDLDIRDTLALILRGKGYSVAGAANGEEALAYLRHAAQPCLILLDLMMPVMDGTQFRTEQQKDPELADIPVVVVSADGAVHQKAASIGAAASLKKPIDLDVLLDLVGRFCRKPS